MGSDADTPLEPLRRTALGHSQRDFSRVLEYYGFVEIRRARHGVMFRHPDLTAHPDLEVRQKRAWVLIPNDCERKPYVAREVVDAVELLLAWQAQQPEKETPHE